MSKRDYYEVLGVARDADQIAIKKAWRKLAREYHPDNNQGDKTAEERFKEGNEAYEILGYIDKRQKYDNFGFGQGQEGGVSQSSGEKRPAKTEEEIKKEAEKTVRKEEENLARERRKAREEGKRQNFLETEVELPEDERYLVGGIIKGIQEKSEQITVLDSNGGKLWEISFIERGEIRKFWAVKDVRRVLDDYCPQNPDRGKMLDSYKDIGFNPIISGLPDGYLAHLNEVRSIAEQIARGGFIQDLNAIAEYAEKNRGKKGSGWEKRQIGKITEGLEINRFREERISGGEGNSGRRL